VTAGDGEPDPVDWVRERWRDQALPEADRFAAAAALMRIHQVVTSAIADALRPHGLNRTSYLMLVTLALSPHGTRRLSYLARYLMVHQTTVTQLVDLCEQRGLVARRPHPSDRRATLACLTTEGRALLGEATADAAAIGFGLGGVDEPTVQALSESLQAARRHGGDASV
jgi:DNA-binding MarR family transcriptional regulator